MMDASMDADFNPGSAAGRRAAAGRGRVANGTLIGGRFQVRLFLGGGSFGERYRAVDGKTDRQVEIRILDQGLFDDPAALDRLHGDIQRAAGLSHKNIAATYGIGRENELHYIATEFIDGQSLRELIDAKNAQQKVFSLKGAYNVIAHVCNALAYAHATQFHGALSPSTLLVNRAGRVKLTDFGIGQTLPALLEFQAQLAAGQFYCMAPELAQAPATADRRADIYSVGVVLFELLTGSRPAESFESPAAKRADLPKALDAVLERCLRPEPEERFVSAEELKQSLFLAVEQASIPQVAQAKGVPLVARVASQPEISLEDSRPPAARARPSGPPPAAAPPP